MKNATKKNVKDIRTGLLPVQVDVSSLQEQLAAYEKEKHILLDLSNDITKVREKNDLIRIFSSRLKGFFYFTHAVVSLIDPKNSTYYPFLIDTESLPIRHRDELPRLLKTRFELDDPFLDKVRESEVPVAFLLDEIINIPGVPAFIKVNYECGIREAMIAKLKSKMETIGYVFIYSDRAGSFTVDFKNVVQGIASHLSNAVANIITNDEIVTKEKDKSFLLDFSHNVASARTRQELSLAIHGSLKKLSHVKAYFIRVLNDEGTAMLPFMHDNEVFYKDKPEFKELLDTKIPTDTGITARVLKANNPVLVDFVEETRLGHTDPYIEFWKKLGSRKTAFQKIIGTALRMGHKTLGILWVITDDINMTILEGICAQVSVAISNIKSNEEITERETEKSILLSLSGEIAALKSREDLLKVVNRKFKTLFSIEDFGLLQINEDATYSTFMLDLRDHIKSQDEFVEISSGRYSVSDPVFTRMMDSEEPIVFDVNELGAEPGMPAYVGFWKKLGLRQVLGTALRGGGKNIGCAFLHIDANKTGQLKINLLKAICAQIAVAISNIRSSEEIIEREREKSILLSLSDEIAALRSRSDLLHVVNTRLKALFSIKEFGIAQIDEDRSTYSAFVLDISDETAGYSEFKEVTSAKYRVNDQLFTSIMKSEGPILFDVNKLSTEARMPAYVGFWKSAGVRQVLAMALRAGGQNIGCAFLHLDNNGADNIKANLLKAVCSQLAVAVSNILANEQVLAYKQLLEVENDHLKEQIRTIYNFDDIIGSGPEMQKVYHLMSLVAQSNSTVLLLGETGTGKELIARAIHNASPRKDKLMVKVNCAALPAHLIESELFGHEKGSFTGAIERRIGKFELANNSTLFLDEIGEMPLDTQVKLLRVIQERELERVGGRNTISINVRIIAATNRNLEEEVNAGKFRPDLFYRLNVFPIHLPPLRERLEDIEPLAQFFLDRYSKNTGRKVNSISARVIKELKGYLWPGNVRELEHLIERSILLCNGNALKEIQLPGNANKEKSDSPLMSNRTLHDIERSYIIEVLARCNGKIAGADGAAAFLEVPPTTLHSKMKKLGISKADYFLKKSL